MGGLITGRIVIGAEDSSAGEETIIPGNWSVDAAGCGNDIPVVEGPACAEADVVMSVGQL